MHCAPIIPDKAIPDLVRSRGLNLYSAAVGAFHEERLAALDAQFKEGTGLFDGPHKDRAAKWWLLVKVDANSIRDHAKRAGMTPAVYEAIIHRSIEAARVAAASVRPGEKPDRKKFYPWL